MSTSVSKQLTDVQRIEKLERLYEALLVWKKDQRSVVWQAVEWAMRELRPGVER
jgi:hypothetical protein